MADDPVTQWLQALQANDPAAAQKLWERYFERLVRFALTRLPDQFRRAADEEDVALSAFHSFCLGVERGRFPQLQDREDLWRLLLTITARKAQFQVRHQTRHKRGGGKVLGESALQRAGADPHEAAGLGQVPGDEPTPELAAEVAEECRRLLNLLEDEALRSVALLKMEGYTVEEIAQRVGCARRSVERRLQLIRKTWAEAAALEEGPA
jgi:DNA-directed RNA polymerase specialized sigma24 family protein